MKQFAFLFFFLSLWRAPAQTDDFNDGNDTGWFRFVPLQPSGVTSITFPDGGYRLACQPSPNAPAYGPSRVSALRPSVVYTDFVVCVDFTAWDVTQDTSMGLLARLQPNPAPGNINGYALTYQGNDRDLEINRVTNESGLKINAGRTNSVLDPAKTYRMVFLGIGSYLEGRIYDRDNPLLPLVTVTATDSVFSPGSSGILVFSGKNTAIAATFDNYRADTGAAPALGIGRRPSGGFSVFWPTEPGLAWRLESSATLLDWSPQAPGLLENGMTKYQPDSADLTLTPARFYRLAQGPVPVPP